MSRSMWILPCSPERYLAMLVNIFECEKVGRESPDPVQGLILKPNDGENGDGTEGYERLVMLKFKSLEGLRLEARKTRILILI